MGARLDKYKQGAEDLKAGVKTTFSYVKILGGTALTIYLLVMGLTKIGPAHKALNNLGKDDETEPQTEDTTRPPDTNRAVQFEDAQNRITQEQLDVGKQIVNKYSELEKLKITNPQEYERQKNALTPKEKDDYAMYLEIVAAAAQAQDDRH